MKLLLANIVLGAINLAWLFDNRHGWSDYISAAVAAFAFFAAGVCAQALADKREWVRR